MTAPTLAITPLSPVATAAVLCRLGGALWATVVVKATFELVHGEPARLVAPADLVREDQANAANGSLERARETAPHVPNAGVLLTGHAHAPNARAVPSMSVRLGISREKPLIDKTLHVFGERGAGAPSVITPFQKMPLVYERAFGGAGVWENPVGRGGPGSGALPNIVDPRDPRRVAGFGPVARQWAPRRALSRGVDPPALGGAVWDVPAGFDWRFFQAAPADQQMDRFRGDEWILLDGMHPGLARVQSRLPQVTALARRRVLSGTSVAEHPIELRADMLVIDADRLSASLVWRGRFAAPSLEALAQMEVFAGLERPGQPVVWPLAAAAPAPKPQPISVETQDLDLRAVLGGAVPFSPGRPSAPLPAATAKPAPLSTGTAAVDVRAILKGPVPFAGAREATEPCGPSAPLAGPSVGTATVMEIPAVEGRALPFAPAGGSRPSSASVATSAAQKPAPMSTGTTDVDLAEILKGAMAHRGRGSPAQPVVAASELAAVPAPAPPAVAPPDVAALPPAGPPLPPEPPPPPAPPAAVVGAEAARVTSPSVASAPAMVQPAPAALARSRAAADLAAGSAFDGQDFAGANLSGLDFSDRSLARCNLRGAKLRGTIFARARLADAVLDEADLRGAILSGADLRNASLIRSDLEHADLSRCQAAGATLTEANLLGANLCGSHFAGASFEGAVLREVEAAGAELAGARMERADLSTASFRRAKLTEATLAGANLDRADLQGADLEGADLRGATRRRTRLAGANLKGADGGGS